MKIKRKREEQGKRKVARKQIIKERERRAERKRTGNKTNEL